MDDVPRRVQITMNCPHCGHAAQAAPEFVEALIASGKIQEVEVHIQAARRSYERYGRGTVIMFSFVAFSAFLSGMSAWIWPGVVESGDLVAAHLMGAATAVAAAYTAWVHR